MAEAPDNNLVVPPPSPSLLDRVKGLGAYGILVTCLGLGMAIATIFWASTNSALQADLRRVQEQLVTTTAALERAKMDLARGQESASSTGGSLPHPEVQPGASPVAPNQGKVKIRVGDVATFFDGDLRISLIGTQFQSDLNGYMVAASVSSPGHSPMKIGDAEVGARISYKGKTEYDIELLNADSISATFLVGRK